MIRATPNASLHDNAVGYGSITLRGIGSYGAANSIQNIALYSAATAIVFDGVALSRSAMACWDLSAFDLNQVEVFRGPQSTSQGRNAMAGAVIRIRRRAQRRGRSRASSASAISRWA